MFSAVSGKGRQLLTMVYSKRILIETTLPKFMPNYKGGSHEKGHPVQMEISIQIISSLR